MKYIRIDMETKTVVEIFPYNPFKWIVSLDGTPNEEFLADCRALDDGVEVDYGWTENEDGTYSPPNPEPEPIPEQTNPIDTLTAENELLKRQVTDLQLVVCDLYEAIISNGTEAVR